MGSEGLQKHRPHNQPIAKVIAGENYIVVNYKDNTRINKIWVLWEAEDGFFSPRKSNSNARSLNQRRAALNIQVIYRAPGEARPDA